jgi:Flp pilus assembly protein TadD
LLVAGLSLLTQKQIGIWKNGETLWTYVIQYDDQVPLAYKQLGVSLFQKARYTAAAEMMSKALSLDPRDAELLNNLAICYLELGKLEEAMQVADKALRLEKDAPFVLSTLAEIHMARHDYSNANQAFFRAMQLEPENPLRFFNLAVSFDKLEDTRQACFYWRRYMAVDASETHDDEIIQHLADSGCPISER